VEAIGVGVPTGVAGIVTRSVAVTVGVDVGTIVTVGVYVERGAALPQPASSSTIPAAATTAPPPRMARRYA
jgi:hypothetical protein